MYIVGSAVIFGTMEVALKLAGNSFDPFQITFLRFLIGGLVLAPFAVHEYRSKPAGFMTKQMWLSMLLLGAINVPCCMIFFQLGVIHLGAATAAVIFCSNPVFTMLAAHVLTNDDKMNRRKALALTLGVIGLILMIKPWDMQEGNTPTGALFSLASAAIFGIYSVLGAKTVGRVGAFTQTSSSFLLGALLLFAMLPALGRPIFSGVLEQTGLLLYVSIVVTGGGYLLYFLATKNSNATTASLIFFLKPVIAPIFAIALLGETLTWNMFVGIAVILSASYILTFRKKA